MKCKYCGADINPKSEKCEYCGSYIEREESKQTARRPINEENRQEQKSKTIQTIIKAISKVVIAWIVVWAILVVVVLIIVLNSNLAKNRDYTNTSSSGSESINVIKDLPANEKGLIGTIVQYENGENASVEYDGKVANDVKILDKKLTKFLKEYNKEIDGIGIYFDTDSSGDITTIGFLSDPFVVIDTHGNDFVALRGSQILCISGDEIEVGNYYSGYFTYPDMKLIYTEKESDSSFEVTDPICQTKYGETTFSIYTEKEIRLYQVCVDDEWYSCSKEVYDSIQEGDSLTDYEFHLDPRVILKK